MTEKVEPIYFNADRLRRAPQILYRMNMSGRRYYYNVGEDGMCKTYPSVTSILDTVMPKDPYLIKWISEMGIKKAEEYAKSRADYGTFMHLCIGSFLIQRAFDPETIDARIETFVRSNKVNCDTRYWRDDIINDMAAFYQFANDRQLSPVAIEIMLASDKLGFAGAIDLVAEITVGTGKNNMEILKSDYNPAKGINKCQRVLAIIDFKSGRKGFHANNEAQIHMYKAMWNEHFPENPVEHIFNWSPKDWRSKPDYNFTCQDDSIEASNWPLYVKLFQNSEKATINKTKKIISGTLRLCDTSETSPIAEVKIEELLRRTHVMPHFQGELVQAEPNTIEAPITEHAVQETREQNPQIEIEANLKVVKNEPAIGGTQVTPVIESAADDELFPEIDLVSNVLNKYSNKKGA